MGFFDERRGKSKLVRVTFMQHATDQLIGTTGLAPDLKFLLFNWLLPALLAMVLPACSADDPPTSAPTKTAEPAVQLAVEPPVAPAAAPTAAPAADSLATFSWDDDMCHFSGRYNPRRYTRRQLTDTYTLLSIGTLRSSATAYMPEDVAQLRPDSLEAEYARVRTQVVQLQLVPGSKWRELRRLKLQEVDDQYRAKKLTLQGYANPSQLLQSTYPASCQAYVRGLALGEDSLIRQSWVALLREQQQHNGAPEKLQQRFDQQQASANWRAYAQVALMSYGWWNCINHTIRRVQLTPALHQQYEALFSELQTACEDEC